MGAAQNSRVAFITGIAGQDGSYLTEHLLGLGYSAIHGLVRRTSITARPRIDHLQGESRLHLHYGDVLDAGCLHRLLWDIQPLEIYHLAAQSQVHVSFGQPEYTADVDYLGTVRILEAFRAECPQARFYNAASSEMFGSSPPPQDENTPFRPCSPYGIAKLAAYWAARNVREAYGLFVANGILFNHESPRRGESFVSRKITRGVARIALGREKTLRLGNLEARRDWGHAKDYVRAMQMMMQIEGPLDMVIATGSDYSVMEFVQRAADSAEKQNNLLSLDVPVETDDAYRRPAEVNHLRGDASFAKRMIGWEPEISFGQLVDEMVDADLLAETRSL